MQRVLIADDDPVSLHFFAAAIGQLGGDAVSVADGAAALTAAQKQSFDLMLLDRCMPGLGGADLLLALRALGIVTPAIATSAEIDDAAIAAQLHAAGFVDIIEKPATLATLERVLGPLLHFSSPPPAVITTHAAIMPILDDDAALTAIGGDANALSALRGLLAKELDEVLTQWASADLGTHRHVVAWRKRLHRLRASCGFCGAAALAESVINLDSGLLDDVEKAQPLLREFIHVCRQTLGVLRDQDASAAEGVLISPSIPQARKPAPSR